MSSLFACVEYQTILVHPAGDREKLLFSLRLKSSKFESLNS